MEMLLSDSNLYSKAHSNFLSSMVTFYFKYSVDNRRQNVTIL